jgi:hypothetical protein
LIRQMASLAFAVATIVAFGGLNSVYAQVPPSRALASASPQIETGQDVVEGRPLVDVRAAPDLPIWKRVTLGTLYSVSAVREALENAHVHIGDSANEALGRPAFALSQTRTESDLVVVEVADLGFGEAGASLADVYARAKQFGLELCPAEVAPYLRLQYLQQPVGEFLQIAMNPVSTYEGAEVDLAVADGGEGLLLVGGEARPDRVANGAVHFVFVRPRKAIVSAGSDMR